MGPRPSRKRLARSQRCSRPRDRLTGGGVGPPPASLSLSLCLFSASPARARLEADEIRAGAASVELPRQRQAPAGRVAARDPPRPVLCMTVSNVLRILLPERRQSAAPDGAPHGSCCADRGGHGPQDALRGTGFGVGVCAIARQMTERAGYPFRMMWFTPLLGAAMVLIRQHRRGRIQCSPGVEATADPDFCGALSRRLSLSIVACFQGGSRSRWRRRSPRR